MGHKSLKTFWVKIYLSGPIEKAKDLLRAECFREGLCVTVDPTHYIYTGGEEAGYVVGLIQYPRFPTTEAKILKRAKQIARKLLNGTHQRSALLMTPCETFWITKSERTIAKKNTRPGAEKENRE